MRNFFAFTLSFMLASCMGGLGSQEDGDGYDEPPEDTTADDAVVVPDVTDGTGDIPETPVEVPDIPVEPVECIEDAQCSDGDMCNGKETCDPVLHVCIPGTPPPDGTTCGPGGVCCGGLCMGCCFDRDCDDDNDCTLDRCEGGACVNAGLADGSPCSGGVCCGNVCRAGGNCCSDADCTAGCRGTARPCADFDNATCTSQAGCTVSGEGSCGGTMNCSVFTNEADCNACNEAGCIWLMSCIGLMPDLCRNLTSDSTCTACGCSWSGECSGTHPACSAYLDWETCNSQHDCYWSTCSSYSCT